ncbi:MAG: cyclic 2,3-diphosphoglycerate synthase [Phycisphaerae bacterium]
MSSPVQRTVIIVGAAGRDFHDFNVFWRDHPNYRVACFTAAQIPNIEGRVYPPELAGPRYPRGVPIFPESRLTELIAEHGADVVALAYSDLSHEAVMHKAALANAAGADFCMLGTRATMLDSGKPVIAVCAVRTGCGKSQTSRAVAQMLQRAGQRVAVVRHPMPYGDLRRQICQRFATLEDLERHDCTIEEREEYEPHLVANTLVFAGVDYARILAAAQAEADVILWDGGNNDTPFFRPKLHVTVVDPHRPGHETRYYPGETNVRMADVVIVNKVDSCTPDAITAVIDNVRRVNPRAEILAARSPVAVADPQQVRGQRVLCVEDGPTVTHGEMAFGAAHLAAERFGAAEIVDPRPYAVGSIRDTFARYTHLRDVLPAMGYGTTQIAELQRTIAATPCDRVLIGTPIDLARVLKLDRPAIRVRYDLDEVEPGRLEARVRQAVT